MQCTSCQTATTKIQHAQQENNNFHSNRCQSVHALAYWARDETEPKAHALSSHNILGTSAYRGPWPPGGGDVVGHSFCCRPLWYSALVAKFFHCSAAALGLPFGQQCLDQSVFMSAAEKLVASAAGFRRLPSFRRKNVKLCSPYFLILFGKELFLPLNQGINKYESRVQSVRCRRYDPCWI